MRGNHLIREARRRAGLSQAELASRAGTTQPAIARLEAGKTSPALERIVSLVRACGFELEFRLVPQEATEWTAVLTNLELTPAERLRRAVAAARFVARGREALGAQASAD